jgi:lysophospholipase L1-like esterase
MVAGVAESSSGPPRYVAVGDSLAGSSQPHGPRNQGYVERLWRFERRSTPALVLVKLGRGGETAASMVHSPRRGPSQLDAAEAALRAHPTVLVTIDVGANEVERCHRGTGFRARCVEGGIASLRRNLPRVLRGLRRAAPRSTPIIGINYYNSFLGAWVRGSGGRALARRSVAVERRINANLGVIYRRFHVPLANVEDAFATDQLHRYVHLSPYGRLPLAVARVCRWTWACRRERDDHANATGYAVIARVVERVLAARASRAPS